MMGSASPAAGRGPALVCFELAQKQRRIKIMATGYDKSCAENGFWGNHSRAGWLASWLAALRTRIRIVGIWQGTAVRRRWPVGFSLQASDKEKGIMVETTSPPTRKNADAPGPIVNTR